MDINGGQLTQTNGNPALPGTTFEGPLIAGGVLHSDGTGNLAGVGGTTGTANTGYAVMAQTSVIKQATNGSVAGVWTDPNLIIPAQSQILRITLMVTTAWTGSVATFGIGNTSSATAYTAAAAGTASARGIVVLSPGTNATAIGNWDNVGTSDVQIVVTSTNTGNGVGTLTVEYVQGINNAS
jgi:hypothetical protein